MGGFAADQRRYTLAFFEWTDDLSVDVPIIDAQHKRLYLLSENLFKAMQKGAGRDALAVTLRELVNYTATHFAAEERVMAQRGFAGLAAHRQEHAAFTAKILDFQTKFTAGNAHISVELMQFLKAWLDTHIRKKDTAWASSPVAAPVK